MNKVSVIDYDAGNTMSVVKALEYLGMNVELTGDKKSLVSSDRIVFPGVGAYFDAMKKLEKNGLIDCIKEIVSKGTPFLGICLGMQMLFDYSEETIGLSDASIKSVPGLGILGGSISKFDDNMGLKIPHMGWNSLDFTGNSKVLFKDIPNNSYVYFVHSYYLKAGNVSDVAATCKYGIDFDAAVEKGNIMGCQFHPEKSGDTGLQILKNFCSY